MATKKKRKGHDGTKHPTSTFGPTPCPTGCGGHTKWIGTSEVYHFECSNCDWTTKPLQGGNGQKRERIECLPLRDFRPDLVPDQLRPRIKGQKFDVSFIEDTKRTITIRHRDGEIIKLQKVPYAKVVERLAREKKGA